MQRTGGADNASCWPLLWAFLLHVEMCMCTVADSFSVKVMQFYKPPVHQ